MNQTRVPSDLLIPPGEHLADTLAELKTSQSELARRVGPPQQTINEEQRTPFTAC
jgi:plasmid maintenance system antidote protein VapI